MTKEKAVILPDGYEPSNKEEYMGPMHLEYFRNKLLEWKHDLQHESLQTVEHLKKENWKEPDSNDQATITQDTTFELRTRDRYRKLMDKIDSAIDKIDRGEYGYCEETGEEIGVKRLQARPIATLCLEAQEKHEKFEKSHSDD